MKPLLGLVRSSSRGKLVVELDNGETAQFQKRDGLRCGDTVWVGYDVENLKYNHIIRKQDPELQGNLVPVLEEELPDVHVYEGNLVQMSEELEDSPTEHMDEDYYEVLRVLSQDNEDVGSSHGG